MTCSAVLASACDGPTSIVYLGSRREPMAVCTACGEVASRLGMEPRAEYDRRAVQRMPEWRRRSLAKVLDHGAVA